MHEGGNLNEEWNDSLAAARIVWKFLFVIAMLAKSPYCHLIETSQGKQASWQALSHDCEEYPRVNLVSVIWARDEVEQSGERIASGLGDLALSASGWAQVAKSQMN